MNSEKGLEHKAKPRRKVPGLLCCRRSKHGVGKDGAATDIDYISK